MKHDITEYSKLCVICQHAKHSTSLPIGFLSPLHIPTHVWEDIAMDFITGLPNSCGFTVIFMTVDRLNKFGQFFLLKTDYDSKIMVEVFIKNIVKLHIMLKLVVWDRDKVLTSKFLQLL